jgi:hypothetical protein
MCRAIDQRGRKRLAAQIADIDGFRLKRGDGVQTGRLSAHCIYSGGRNFDIFAIAKELPEKAFRHRTATNITGTNEEDAFHNSGALRSVGEVKIKPDQVKTRIASTHLGHFP